ncbi:MAG: serine/threonine protein kinase, partial [Planctomycetes bacterium]|nr:serine/threonine protein kinase [Planctomycetota bacterium]
MTDKPMDWEAIYSLVDLARELPPAEREAYLETSCKGDESLREQVRKILGAEVHSKFLEPPSRHGPGLFGGGLQGKRMGRYQLEREIARGGMGVIYLANEIQDEHSSAHEQAFQGEQVVVKVLPQIQRTKPEIFARFQREAEAASQLQHPHALRVLGSGETEGVAWYAMPFVEGHDLHQEIRDQKANSKQCLWPAYGRRKYLARTVEEIAGIADALHGYHSKGIIHRDIKPRNLLLNLSGHLMLADFGLAKISDLETLTQLGAVQGTPHYMSPEQTRIMRTPIDQRTDIYSLCVVLYELLALTRPYEAKSADV